MLPPAVRVAMHENVVLVVKLCWLRCIIPTTDITCHAPCLVPLPSYGQLAVLLASADWIESKWRRSVMLLVMAVIWFRCDVLVLLGPVLFSMLQTRKVCGHVCVCV